MKLAADAESKGLTGRQVVDAETPRREDEVVIHVTGGHSLWQLFS